MANNPNVWNGIKNIGERMKAALRGDEERGKFLEAAGELCVEKIVAKARSGQTLAINGQESDLKPLSPHYIEFRQDIEGFAKANGSLSRGTNAKGRIEKMTAQHKRDGRTVVGVDPDFFSPSKSNLTLTGQLLKSLKVLFVDIANGTVTVGASGTRKPGGASYLKLPSSNPTNAEILSYQSKQGRPILGLDEITKKRVAILAKQFLRQTIRKNVLKK